MMMNGSNNPNGLNLNQNLNMMMMMNRQLMMNAYQLEAPQALNICNCHWISIY